MDIEWTKILTYNFSWIISSIIGMFLGHFFVKIYIRKKNKRILLAEKISLLEERMDNAEEYLEDIESYINNIFSEQNNVIAELSGKIDELSCKENYEFKFGEPVMQIEETKVRRKPGPKPKIQE